MARILENNDGGYLWKVTYSIRCASCGLARTVPTLTLDDAKRHPKAVAWRAQHAATCSYRDYTPREQG